MIGCGHNTPGIALAAVTAAGICRATVIEFMVCLSRIEPAVSITPVVQPFLICLQFPGQTPVEENALEELERGNTPRLSALQLHNSTAPSNFPHAVRI